MNRFIDWWDRMERSEKRSDLFIIGCIEKLLVIAFFCVIATTCYGAFSLLIWAGKNGYWMIPVTFIIALILLWGGLTKKQVKDPEDLIAEYKEPDWDK